ncbi:MAG: hypothetical protein SGILL_002690, partial [Bacillariaceae sp.]
GDYVPVVQQKMKFTGRDIEHHLRGEMTWYLLFPSKNPDAPYKFGADTEKRLRDRLGGQKLYVVTAPEDDGFRALFFDSEDKFNGSPEPDDTLHLFVTVGRGMRIVDMVKFHNLDHVLEKIPNKEPEPYTHNGKPFKINPPILVVPNAINPELAQELVDYFTAYRNDTKSNRVKVDNRAQKRRYTIFLPPGDLAGKIDNKLAKSVFPFIEQAYYSRVTGREDYRMGWYDGDMDGFSTTHRDSTFHTHRRWAMSCSLEDDFVGGGLFFPEFSEEMVELPKYACTVFPGALIHGVAPVESGTRIQLLSFLFDTTEDRPTTLQKSFQVQVGRDVRGIPLEDMGMGEGDWKYYDSF